MRKPSQLSKFVWMIGALACLAFQAPVFAQNGADDDPPQSPANASAAGNGLTGNFFSRLFKAYYNDWNPSPGNASEPEPAYRGYPAPVSGPPFPFSVWPYGGSVVIGQPFNQSGPLMQAIWSGPGGDAWKRSGIQIYGWLNGGFNVSTSKEGGYSTFPAAYAERGNSIELDQEVLYIERQPDTVQTDHIDWVSACLACMASTIDLPRRRDISAISS